MGLDVYLYKASRPIAEMRKAKAEAERAYEAISEDVLKRYGVSDFFGNMKRACAERGLGEYGEPEGLEEKIEMASAKYPKHYWKVGYFRSSYNGSGINQVLDRFGLPGLGDMFPAKGDDNYIREIDWKASRDAAAKTLADFRAALEERGPYSVTTIQENPFGGAANMPTSEEDALRLFHEERKRNAERTPHPLVSNHYSNLLGEFIHDGMEVVAMMPGRYDSFAGVRPTTYIVMKVKPYKDEETGKEIMPFESYVRSLEIAVETCDYVLAQPDPERFYFHWSG